MKCYSFDMKRHPISIATWRMWCKLKNKYRNLWQAPKESKCVGSLSQTLTGVKKGRARDLFHAACVGGFGFFSPKDPHSATRGDPVVLGAVRSFNTKLLVAAAGTHNFGCSAASEMTVPCRQIVILSVPGAHMASKEIHLLKRSQRAELSWNLF